MDTTIEDRRQLKVEVSHDLRRAIKIHVAEKEISVREFVEHAIVDALAEGKGELRKR